VIYTRATHHVTYTKDILSNMRRTNDQGRSKVQSPTGNKAQITHTGEASILGNKTVKNILYVPYFKFNLLFVSKLTKDLSFLATFFPDFCMFTDLYSGKVTGIGGDKFSPRARKSVIIGYYETQKGYSLFDLDARKVFISRDVSFREQAFLFKEGTQITEDLFPCEPLIPNDSLPEHSLQSSSSEVQITPEESNSSTAHDQVEAAQAPTLDLVKDAVDSVDTIDPTETIDVQSGTNPIPSQSLTEHVASETADVRKSSRTTRPSIWLKNYVT
ncbi:hypothetical protein A4A49_56531, partial [Nicotiana attenuata]